IGLMLVIETYRISNFNIGRFQGYIVHILIIGVLTYLERVLSKLFIKIDNPVNVLACNSTLSHCLRECREFWLRSGMSVVLSVGRREPCSTVYQLACSVAAKLQHFNKILFSVSERRLFKWGAHIGCVL